VPRILFISTDSGPLARKAAEVARELTPRAWEVWCCVPNNDQPEELVHDPSGGILRFLPIQEAAANSLDVVIQMSHTPLASDLVFADLPIRICWHPEDFGYDQFESPASIDLAWDEQRDQILRKRLRELFVNEILEAGLRIRLTFGSLINHLTEGVMAHDKNRKIFLWNRTAELITGFKAEDVIGKDCHQIFPDRFCGGDCSFCEHTYLHKSKLRYTNHFVKKNGQIRDLEMSVVTLDTTDRGVIGALVLFRDMTELYTLRRKTHSEAGFHGMVGKHQTMLKVYEAIEDLANVNVPILILGDSGTGKEMVARALHEIGPRAQKPLVPVNCGALPEGTLESELFGHVRGAFTGAIRDKKGRFELADGGILFLDEIGEISPNLQVKLLRVLQENQFVPVGGEKTISVDVRIVCATNRNLKEMTQKGLFREDLYYRLAVVPITLPSLRERIDDIPALIDHYLTQVSSQIGAHGVVVSDSAMEMMLRYSWPGNVRELRNAVQYGIIKSRSGTILPEHLPPEVQDQSTEQQVVRPPGRPSKLSVENVQSVMQEVDGNKAKAARLLGVSRTTLYKTLTELDLDT
jgi:sigma-54 dependent transcriptional regulator, acetoin dehydrogenase operon transcriptional activator AcoR